MKNAANLAYNVLMIFVALAVTVYYATVYLHPPHALNCPEMQINSDEITRQYAQFEKDLTRATDLWNAETPAAFRELAGFLDNPHPYVRLRAATSLWEFDDPAIREALISRFPVEEEPLIKISIAGDLGLLREKRAIPMIQPLLNSADAGIAAQAAYSLGLIGDDSAAGAIAELLQSKEYSVREKAARSLGMLANPDSLGPLKAALDAEKYPELCVLLKSALLESGDNSYEADVRAAVGDAKIITWVRAWAARTLAKRGDAEAAQALLGMLVSPEFFHGAYMLWRQLYPDIPEIKLHSSETFPGEVKRIARWIAENKFDGKLKPPE
jgi:hypothetical protein